MLLKFSNLPTLPTLPTLLNLSNFLLFPNFPSINGRVRYFRSPQSVVPAIFASAKPRSKSPSKEGDLGGG